ncbi:hypothetical protein HYC85_016804, partial [Camellia sinensis]
VIGTHSFLAFIKLQIEPTTATEVYHFPYISSNKRVQPHLERKRETMDNRERKINVLMLPWLAHGHTSPFLELAKKLTHRNFHIYFCSTPIILNSIKKNLDHNNNYNSLSIKLVEFHPPSSLDLPPHYHTTNGLPTHLMTTLRTTFDMSGPIFSDILKTLNPDLKLGKLFLFKEIFFRGFKTLMSCNMVESSVEEVRKDKYRYLEAMKQSCEIFFFF